MPQYDVIALLSGGLDSLLAARLIQGQGKKVLGLNFVTPFFGKAHLIEKWKNVYGLEAVAVDVSKAFVSMLVKRPEHGFGKLLNPCLDCKILLLSKARELMLEYGARVIITGEVLGQRPMSQRRDALNIIKRQSGVNNLLLRPLCAKHLEETEAELSGFIDRSRLLALSGRNRKGQLALAKEFGITDIPTPAGGCLLTERENARAYWTVLRFVPNPVPDDFRIAKNGRQYWQFAPAQINTAQTQSASCWLSIGRSQAENEKLEALAQKSDLLFSLVDFAGPTALGRVFADSLGNSNNSRILWDNDTIHSAAAFVASFSGKALKSFAADGRPVAVVVKESDSENILSVKPERNQNGIWGEYSWDEAKEEIRAEARAKANFA